MKEIKMTELKNEETYLVFVGYDWSISGFDLAEYQSFTKTPVLISQSNGQDIINCKLLKFYELPVI